MPLYQVVVLAVVQAVTEFLPISSTGHLILFPWLLGWRDHGLLFDVALHFGTVLAVLAYFAKTWVRILFLAFGRKALPPPPGDPDEDLYENPKLFGYLVAATFPAGVAGLLLQDYVETTLRSPYVVATMLIAVGLVIWWAEARGGLERGIDSVGLREALLIGCAQALALIPGTSRSGATITAGLLLGLKRSAAARFSFILSCPIVVGASAKAAYDLWRQGGLPADLYIPFATGVLVSGVCGYAVIAVFLRFLQKNTMRIFVYYRIAFGIMVLALAAFFRFSANGH